MYDSCYVYYPTKREFLLEVMYFVHFWGEEKEEEQEEERRI